MSDFEPASDRPTNRLATTAAALGVGSLLLPILGPLAILAGVMSLKKSPTGRGKAIAGVLLGLFSVIFGTVVAVIAIPKLRAEAGRSQCLDNLRQMVPGINAYAFDAKGYYAPDLETMVRLKYIQPAVPPCPAGHSYRYLAAGLRSTKIAKPSATVIIIDAPGAHTPRRLIALFADGHGEELDEAETKQVLDAIQSGNLPPVLDRGP
jgi:hypothetical protein